jgi:hypothetical protein
MEMVERKTIVEGYIAEGRMSELSMIVDDIIDGRLDINDIISGKFIPTSDLEEFVQQTLIKSYEETARDNGLSADDDKIIGIMYNDIHNIMSNALNKDIDEQAMPGAAQPGMTTSTTPTTSPAGQSTAAATTQQQFPVKNSKGETVGNARTAANANQATQKLRQNDTKNINNQAAQQSELDKLGVTLVNTQVQESLSDTMNRFSSILNESKGRRTVGRRTLSESKTPMLVLEGTLEEIIAVHPHEHKMYQQGWGLDPHLYDALCDHYHKDGRIPRNVWHGSSEDLRNCVEQCYLQDTQPLMGEKVKEGSLSDVDWKDVGASTVGSVGGYMLGNATGIPLAGIAGAGIGGAIGSAFAKDDEVKEDDDNHEVAAGLGGAALGGGLGYAAGSGALDGIVGSAMGMIGLEEADLDEGVNDLDELRDKIEWLMTTYHMRYGEAEVSAYYDEDPETWKDSPWENEYGMKEGFAGGALGGLAGAALTKSPSGAIAGAKFCSDVQDSFGKKNPFENEEMDIRRHAMNRLIDELDESTYGTLKTDMSESKKPSAGMTKDEKSSLVKKAKSGKDIGKPGKGFDKLAKKAAKEYGSAEKGKKVAAAAMWKNAAPTNEATDAELDQAAISKSKSQRGRDALANKEKTAARNRAGSAAQDARAKLDKVRQSETKVKESAKPDFLDLNKNGNKKESMKKAASDKKKVKENVNVAQMQAGTFRPGDKAIARDGSQVTIAKVEGNGDVWIKSWQDNTPQRVDARTLKSVGSSGKALAESYDFSEWDNQLSSLLKPTPKQTVSESAKIKKQMITESSNELSTMLQFAGLKSVQQVMEEFNASIYADDSESTSSTDGSDNPPQLAMPTGMGMSQQKEEDDESSVVEPMMSDEVIGGLAKGDKESAKSDNDHLSFFKKMLSHGQSEVKTEKPKSESGEQSGIPASTSQSPVSGNSSEKPVTEKEDDVEEDKGDGNLANNAKPYDKVTQGDVVAGRKGEDEEGGKKKDKKEESTVKEDTDVTTSGNGDNSEEQSEVSSDATRDAGLAQGDSNFFSSENSSTMAEDEHQGMSSDGIIGDILAKLTQLVGSEQGQPAMSAEPPVMVDVQYTDDEQSQDYADEESQDEEHCDQCQSCGETMYEDHQCMESLNEWANSPTGESADEQFQTDMDFMTKVISGGLNNQKQDQTTLPSTRVVTRDESKDVSNTMGAMLRKLSGIN